MSIHEEALERNWKTLYVLGELPEPERTRFEQHFFDCPSCSDAVQKSYLLVRGAEATFNRQIFAGARPVAVPERRQAGRPHPRRWALQVLPYAAILCLSLGVGTEYLALHEARSPQTVVSFAIPAQAKGEAHKVVLPAGGGLVELQFDLYDTAPEYHWEIKSAGEPRASMSGQARPPRNSVILKLAVPSARLHPGRYEAVISFPPGHRTTYPFEVTGPDGSGNP